MTTYYLTHICIHGNEAGKCNHSDCDQEPVDIEVLEYKGDGGGYEYNNLNLFCKFPHKKTWNNLNLVEKELLVTVSHFCLDHGKGDEELSRIIIKISTRGDYDEGEERMRTAENADNERQDAREAEEVVTAFQEEGGEEEGYGYQSKQGGSPPLAGSP